MKTLLIVTIFITNILYANYSFTEQNSGKIDMHGGKGEKLMGESSLGREGLKSLGNIPKPLSPLAPKPLIEKKDTKKQLTPTKK